MTNYNAPPVDYGNKLLAVSGLGFTPNYLWLDAFDMFQVQGGKIAERWDAD